MPLSVDGSLSVTHVFPMIEAGGSQLATLQLALALREHAGVTSKFLAGCATDAGRELFAAAGYGIDAFADTYEWGMAGPWTHEYADWLRTRLDDCDIAHGHHGAGWWPLVHAAPAGLPVVASEHSVPPYSELIIAQQTADAPRIERFFAQGPGVRALAARIGIDAARVRSCPISVPDQDAQPRAGLPQPRIVFAGRLVDIKGVDVLLDALALMSAPPQTLILGSGVVEEDLHAQASALGLDDVVEFRGWEQRPGEFIAGASVYVQPSRREAFGATVVQAMGLGVPVIASAVEGLPEVLGHGKRGLLVAKEDPRALADALTLALSGQHGVDLAGAAEWARQFSPASVADFYASEYRQLIARPQRRAA